MIGCFDANPSYFSPRGPIKGGNFTTEEASKCNKIQLVVPDTLKCQ